MDVCAKIWELVNPDGEDKFSKAQFFIAMYLMKKAKDGVNLPSQIPPELKRSVGMVENPISTALVVAAPTQ